MAKQNQAKQSDLKVTERDNTLNPRQLRAAGFIPVTLYGKNRESVQIQAKTHELSQLIMHGSQHFQLSGFVSGPAKLRQLQVDPVSQQPISAQLLSV
ncbi:hypothetical protein [Vampirovibrio chlorellavorus]|uniref:hypothetical protein n=1 Tax=Vampirovibrio chlorellavorus TaxID=758823 RepID=UPI0026F2734B|nr:hypothetical protein [Vampirovibrio chlorellavorus]